jgi:tRNA U38,U39,U40 pseudouridine synthase TruA
MLQQWEPSLLRQQLILAEPSYIQVLAINLFQDPFDARPDAARIYIYIYLRHTCTTSFSGARRDPPPQEIKKNTYILIYGG